MACNLQNTNIPMYVIILHLYLICGLFTVMHVYNMFWNNETRIFPYVAPILFLLTISYVDSLYNFFINKEKKKLNKYEKAVASTYQMSSFIINSITHLTLLILMCYRIYLFFAKKSKTSATDNTVSDSPSATDNTVPDSPSAI